MAFTFAGHHTHRWHRAIAVAGAHHGSASLRVSRSVRATHGHSRVAEYFVQSGWRTNSQSRGRRLFDVSPLWNRCNGSWPDQGNEARLGAAKGGSGVLKKRGKIQRGVVVLGSTFGSMADLTRGMWRSDSHRRWLIPVAIFLCV